MSEYTQIMSDEDIRIMVEAADEIRRLRRANELLSAKVEMINLFACVLHSNAATRVETAAPDVAWQLDQIIRDHAKPRAN